MSTQQAPGQWRYQKPRGPQHAIDRKWEIVEPLPEGGETIIVGEHTGIDCLTEAHAKRIVQAVNSHAELIEALQGTLELLQHSDVRFKICDGGRGNLGEASWYHRTIDAARAALKKGQT